MAEQLGIVESSRVAFLIKNLYECFLQRDCLEIAINPLVLTPKKKFFAANTFIRLDPDSLYRQQELAASLDLSQISRNERIAFNMDIKYSEMGGNIGLVCNSAGLAMASADVLASCGG